MRNQRLKLNPNYVSHISEVESPYEEEITKDVERTYAKETKASTKEALKRVL